MKYSVDGRTSSLTFQLCLFEAAILGTARLKFGTDAAIFLARHR